MQVTCPGVFLPDKDDLYLSVCLMGQYKKSECVSPLFPLVFEEKMRFEKIFKHVSDPAEVAELLEHETVKIELIQLIPPGALLCLFSIIINMVNVTSQQLALCTSVTLCVSAVVGESLAHIEQDVRQFLFPEPKLVPPSPGVDREVLMMRASNFPGIAPRLEFSTRTTIRDCPLTAEKRVFPNVLLVPSACADCALLSLVTRAQCRSHPELVLEEVLREEDPGAKKQGHLCSKEETLLWSRGLRQEAAADPQVPLAGVARERTGRFSWRSAPLQVRERKHLVDLTPAEPRTTELCVRNDCLCDADEGLDFLNDDAEDATTRVGRSRLERWSPPGPERPLSPPALKISHRESMSRNGFRTGPPHIWDVVHERVQRLLNTSRAMRQLSNGSVESEVDDVMRRSITPQPRLP
ncbi:spermatogenesis-associated protein 6-like [Scleropages formosus]|uniref:Spermatogenesis-associated protein 6-like n=1 Tax=Scleropages formosus TaxID=113540 RepID=A0A0P7VRZ0_SCLFO|nr:spermatogenesis-associated protein 6-like [Scleropages formosus]